MKKQTLTGRRRKVDYAKVVAYASANPTLSQAEVGTYFGISQCRVSHICQAAGVHATRRGRPIKADPRLSIDQNEWEAILHDHGLGMERGLRLHNQRILYGYDPIKQGHTDTSATFAAN